MATVASAAIAAAVSLAIALSRFDLRLPLDHLVPITVASPAMAAVLKLLPTAQSLLVVALHVALGILTYVIVLAPFYATFLFRQYRLRQRSSET